MVPDGPVRSGAARMLLAAFLAACGESGEAPPESPWARIEDESFDGINFRDAWGVGEDVWVVGRPFDLPLSVVVHHDGTGWQVLWGGGDLPEDSFSLWATSSDDVWLVGDTMAGSSLWRWDGVTWSPVDLSDALGEATGRVRSVWGTAQDDLWISVAVDQGDDLALRHDGASWQVMLTIPVESKDEYDEQPTIGAGCSVSRDEVWVRASDDYFHWSGGAWEAVDGGGGGALFCSPTALWRYGNSDGGPFAYRHTSGAWSEVVSFDAWQVRFNGLWTDEDGDGWIVGSGLDDEFADWTQIWRILGGDVSPTLEEGSVASLGDGGAIWQTDSGRVLAFGSYGLVLEYTGSE